MRNIGSARISTGARITFWQPHPRYGIWIGWHPGSRWFAVRTDKDTSAVRAGPLNIELRHVRPRENAVTIMTGKFID